MTMSSIVLQDKFASYPDALKALAVKLGAREFSPDEYYIVLCPDRYTQTVEQALFCGGGRYGGAMDCDVLTLSRLSRKLAPGTKTLSAEGGVMITARAIAAVSHELKYYTKAATFGDFAREVYQTLQQIASSDTAPQSIAAVGATELKLHDLMLIKREYDRIKGGYYDPPDKLYAIIQNADSKIIRGAHIYAIGYADTTRLNMRVFDALARYAKSFELYAAKRGGKRRELDVFGAPDSVSEYKQIAAEILEHIYRGGSYSDVAIVCENPRVLKRILGEYEIPTYTDETTPLSGTPPLIALNNIYKLYVALKNRNAWDCRTLAALVKSPFVGCDRAAAEKLGYEVNVRALTFVPKDYAFNDPEATEALSRITDIISAFDSYTEFHAAVDGVMEYCGFSAVQDSLFGDGTDAVSPIRALTELVKRYGSGDFGIDARAFFSAAEAVNVNSVPRERNCVTVTAPQALRLTAVKKLFITDFNEGVMPTSIADSGLITDAELCFLGGAIEPTVREQNRRSRDELKAITANAQSVYVTYSHSNGRCAAFVAELAEKINEYDHAEQRDVLARSCDAQFIAKYAATPGAARELVARGGIMSAPSVRLATAESGVYYCPFSAEVGRLDKKTISVSELSHWFKCPYYRFLSDSVGLKERRSGFGAPDFGIVVHDFMRRFISQSTLDCSVENVQKIIDGVLSERDIKPDGAAYARIVADAVDYAESNARILMSGEYGVCKTEYRFGGMRFGKNAQLEFIGFIDRFDTCGRRARIIDYKTGAKSFDIEDCYNGCDMQLPLYAAAIPYEVTGMFYVRLGKRYSTGKKERAMSGCMIKDVDIALQYDTELMPGGEPSSVVPVRLKTDKNGAVVFSGRLSSALLDKAEFDRLISRCKNNADVAADEIVSGYINRSPIEGACGYCPYRGVCGGKVAERAARFSIEDEEGGDGD